MNMLPVFRYFLTAAPCLLLLGCASTFTPHNTASGHERILPRQQVADFFATDCADIWVLRGDVAEKNPLYWLREIDCASRLSASTARTEARQYTHSGWQDAFRRGILLANARITPPERRDAIEQMDSVSARIPTSVRPLYQIWRDDQVRQIQLAEARMRYSKLQQETDAERDAMRKQQQSLRNELELTERKLENLTDIERQLSSRKSAGSGLSGDAHRADDKHATGGDGAKEKQ